MTLNSNVLIGWPQRMESLTTDGGGAWTAARPLSSLTTPQLDEKARSQSADKRNTWYYLKSTSGAAVAAMLMTQAGHNMGTSGQQRFRGFSTANPVCAVFTGNELPAGWTLTRSGSGATYYGTDGLLKTAAADVARFDFDATTSKCKGLLVESAATNFMLWCRDGSNGAWSKGAGMSAAKTATGIDGAANSATTLTATSGTASANRISQAGATAGVCSVYLRRLAGSGTVRITGDSFATTTTVTLTTSWQRFTVTGSSGLALGVQIDTNGDSVGMDYAQSEGSTSGATTPILTTTATVTRNADSLTIPAATAGISATAGTMMARGILEARPNSGAAIGLGLSDLSANFVGLKVANTGAATANVRTSSSDQADNTGVTLSPGDTFAMAMAWGTNDVRSSFSGAATVTDAAGATMPGALATVYVGRYAATAGGSLWLTQVSLWPTALVNADLESLSGSEAERVAAYDSALVNVWPAAYVAATTAEQREGMPGNAWPITSTSVQSYAYWRVDNVDESNAAGYLEVARPYFTDIWQAEFNRSDISVDFDERAQTTMAASGAEYSADLPEPRWVQFPLPLLSQAETWGQVFELRRRSRTTREVWFSLDPGDLTNGPRFTFPARIRKMSPLELAPRGQASVATVEVKELL